MSMHGAALEHFTFWQPKARYPVPSETGTAAAQSTVLLAEGLFRRSCVTALKWMRNGYINVPECRWWKVKLCQRTAETLQQQVCLHGEQFISKREWVS